MGRVFVGGLSPDTTGATLMEYFGSFGQVADSFIVTDITTRCSKGYGFVTFIDSSVAERVLAHPEHIILGIKVDVKPATPRGPKVQRQEHANIYIGASNIHPNRVRKIFVGGLPHDLTIEEFKAYFEHYGSVEDAILMHDINRKPRGFGFITFHSEFAAGYVLQDRYHELKKKLVEVKRAEPKQRIASDYNNAGFAYQQGSFSPYNFQVLAYDPYNMTGTAYPWQSFVPYYPVPCYGYGNGYAAQFNGYGINNVINSGSNLAVECFSDGVGGNVAVNVVSATDARAAVPTLDSEERNEAEADESLGPENDNRVVSSAGC